MRPHLWASCFDLKMSGSKSHVAVFPFDLQALCFLALSFSKAQLSVLHSLKVRLWSQTAIRLHNSRCTNQLMSLLHQLISASILLIDLLYQSFKCDNATHSLVWASSYLWSVASLKVGCKVSHWPIMAITVILKMKCWCCVNNTHNIIIHCRCRSGASVVFEFMSESDLLPSNNLPRRSGAYTEHTTSGNIKYEIRLKEMSAKVYAQNYILYYKNNRQ